MDSSFWSEASSYLALNPRINEKDKAKIKRVVDNFGDNDFVWIKSSGTESSREGHKLVALTRQAFLEAARSVNVFCKVSSQDHWLNPLPLFHVGGLSVSARCYLAQCKYSELPDWDPKHFCEVVGSRKATITSLVPTQVYDLVSEKRKAPESMRLVLVGGGALDKELYIKARRLGWSLIPSYGMTETCAAMAAAGLDSLDKQTFPQATLLPHVELKAKGDKFAVQSKSLFTGYLFISDEDSQWVPRPEPFILDDRIEYDGQFISIKGRASELIKILGESVNIFDLEKRLTQKIQTPLAVVPVSDERRGHRLMLYVESNATQTLSQINEALMPFEQIEQVISVEKLPRTELGKIIKSQLLN